ncbi:hypothetical protein NFI96_002875 [Prochilodus magdalenae]|nr:hypothetical protein NFI96_002875 [Prochilodus magdalenae]
MHDSLEGLQMTTVPKSHEGPTPDLEVSGLNRTTVLPAELHRVIDQCRYHTRPSGTMPRGDFNVHFASRGRGSYIRAEEYVEPCMDFLEMGLTGSLVKALAFWKKRFSVEPLAWLKFSAWAAGIALLAIILTALLILGCWYYRRRSGYKMIRNARGSSSQSWRDIMRTGQYSEQGAAAENKVALTEFSNLQPAIPNAPPAYEKITSGPLPPPYSP